MNLCLQLFCPGVPYSLCKLFVWHKDEPVRVPSFAVNLYKPAFFSVCATYSFFTDVNTSQGSYCVELCSSHVRASESLG
jgi:hypothetical protein